jgi:hypothetical protein
LALGSKSPVPHSTTPNFRVQEGSPPCHRALKCRSKDGPAIVPTEARFSPYIRERVNAGIARLKARGVSFGRPMTIGGYLAVRPSAV